MSTEGIEATLARALAKTQGEVGLEWKLSSAASTRFYANVGKWRMRIESENGDGEHPFRFSLMQPGTRKGVIDSLRSVEADGPLSDEDRKLNQKLRELWEVAGRSARGVDQIHELNDLLDSLG